MTKEQSLRKLDTLLKGMQPQKKYRDIHDDDSHDRDQFMRTLGGADGYTCDGYRV